MDESDKYFVQLGNHVAHDRSIKPDAGLYTDEKARYATLLFPRLYGVLLVIAATISKFLALSPILYRPRSLT